MLDYRHGDSLTAPNPNFLVGLHMTNMESDCIENDGHKKYHSTKIRTHEFACTLEHKHSSHKIYVMLFFQPQKNYYSSGNKT